MGNVMETEQEKEPDSASVMSVIKDPSAMNVHLVISKVNFRRKLMSYAMLAIVHAAIIVAMAHQKVAKYAKKVTFGIKTTDVLMSTNALSLVIIRVARTLFV